MRNTFATVLAAIAALLFAGAACADAPGPRDFPPGLQIPDAAKPGPDFDVERATEAYINLLSPEQRAQSDRYFEGGYWLLLWGWLYGLGVSWVLLATGLSRRMRDAARRISARPWLYTGIYVLFWVIAGFVLFLPLGIYEDFLREHQYGLATQSFGGFFGDQLKGLMVGCIVTPVVLAFLYSAVRRFKEQWWVAAGIGSVVFLLLFIMIVPVFINPLFNDYKPLPEGETREAVYSMIRANRIPTDDVTWFDASRQTTRVSANVAGFLGTTRVNLNDNLLDKTSLPEIKAVLGHEIAHYVLNHSLRLTIYLSLLLTAGFWCVHRVMDVCLARVGPHWGLEGRDDPAALPLAVAILSTFLFLATPVQNNIIRQAEAEADAYGVNTSQEPHGFAMVAMRLSTYRKIHPGPLEEIIFYDHPSGYDRVRRSMTWLKEHPK